MPQCPRKGTRSFRIRRVDAHIKPENKVEMSAALRREREVGVVRKQIMPLGGK